MKIKHIWSVLCKESVINQDDNLISIHGALEEFTINIAPVDPKTTTVPEKLNIPVNYEIVSFWVKENPKETVKIQIEYSLIDPKGKNLFSRVQDLKIPENIKRHRSRMKIMGLPITQSGDYTFAVKKKEEESKKFDLMAELPLEVKLQIEKPKN